MLSISFLFLANIPVTGRLDQKLDAAVHEEELSKLERKLGQLEQRSPHLTCS